MALFSNKKYYKPGKGVEKDEPEKKAFFRFFELYGRKFWKYIEVNLAYFLILLPLILYIYAAVYDAAYYLMIDFGFTMEQIEQVWTPLLYSTTYYYAQVPAFARNFLLIISALAYGPVRVGVTYVLRNFSNERHSWISDIWDKARENWKYGMFFGVVDILVVFILIFNLNYSAAAVGIMRISRYLTILAVMIYCFMRRYIYLMIVTVDLNLKSLIVNAWLLSFVGIFRNVGSALVNLLIWVGTYLLSLLVWPIAEAVIVPFFIFSFTDFLSVSASYPLIDEYLVKPLEEMTEEEKAQLTQAAEEKQEKKKQKKEQKQKNKKKFDNYYD